MNTVNVSQIIVYVIKKQQHNNKLLLAFFRESWMCLIISSYCITLCFSMDL